MVEAVQSDQRAGLSKWVEYLGGDDGGFPDWFKYFTWTSVTKLGAFDKSAEEPEFQKRSRGTTATYPELNREALAYVYDKLNKSRIQGEDEGAGNDEKLQELLKSANFGKLYAHAVLGVTPASPEQRAETRGSWTKFNQTEDPRTARRLSESLQGHGTDWCTAGESTASWQLERGDFYVYYTRDEDGKDTVPRVAIRMERGQVAEVRGINASQELEVEMADIAAEQLQELPGGEEYIRKAEDMKRLTAIENKISANPDTELTHEELRFLYELDHKIKGFGYEEDPRIKEIRETRGEKDKPELAHVLREILQEQVGSAYEACKTVAEKLSGKRRMFRREEVAVSQSELEQNFELKDKEWQEAGVYDYLVEQLMENGAAHTLVVTPNIEVSEDQIARLAKEFGNGQPVGARINDRLIRSGHYSPQELSGRSGEDAVRLSLIPKAIDRNINYKTSQEQVEVLRDLQAKHPELGFHVPSMLEAVTNWYALRAGGDKLGDRSAYKKTYVRHFDLEPKLIDGELSIPYTSISDTGEPQISYSYAKFSDDGRVAVG